MHARDSPAACSLLDGPARGGDDSEELSFARHDGPARSTAFNPGPIAEHGREARELSADPPLDQLASLGQETDLAVLLVDIDANMVPWRAFPLCGVDRVGALVGQRMPPRRAGGQPLHPIYALDFDELAVPACVA